MASLNRKITDWTGKVVWITGASSGIGFAVAERLIGLGAKVVLSARKPTAQTLALENQSNAYVVLCDVTQADSLRHAASDIVMHWEKIDYVIANAGYHVPMRADAIDLPAATALIQTNLIGAMNTVQVALQFLSPAGGIAIVASVAGFGGLPTGLIYGATKAALINFAESMYLDLAPKGYSVYVINPGFVKTPLTDKNPFSMPFLISPQLAAERIVQGMERGDFEIHFPKRFTGLVKALGYLPYRWYFWLIHRGTRM